MPPQLYSTSRAGDTFSTNPFENAVNFANDVQNTVVDQFDWTKANILGSGSIDSINLTAGAITALGEFELELPTDLQLLEPVFDPIINIEWELPVIDPAVFGTISPFSIGPAPNAGGFPSISSVNIPSFSSSIAHLSIPEPPPGIDVPLPGDAPPTPVFAFPASPVYILPDSPTLIPIVIPPTPAIVLPTLDLSAFPVLQDMNVDTLIPWTEPAYQPEIWADVKAQLQAFLAGGTGIRPDVEAAMVARGTDREERLVRAQVQQTEEEWANRGYASPPGMLERRVDTIREEGLIKKLGLNREVVIKAMDAEIENLRFAVQQGIAGEQLWVGLFLAAAERAFLVQRLHVELQISYHSVLIQAFNAKLQENVVRAQVFEVQVRAALAEIEVFKALIEAESLKADTNKTLIDGYSAEIAARRAIVELYTAEVGAVGVRAQVFESEINAYKATVEAYAERVNAGKVIFEAYTAQVQGEVAKASIVESESRAYAARIGGIEAGVGAEKAALDGAVAAFAAEVDAYRAEVARAESQGQLELGGIQAALAGYQATTQRFIAGLSAEEAESSLTLKAWETKNNITIAQYEAQVKRFQALLEKTVQQANMALEGIKSAGQLSSTISAGALAAMHVGATISGSGGVSASGSDGVSFSYSDSESKSCSEGKSINISFEADSEPDLGCNI
jgi:hypothetical protein